MGCGRSKPPVKRDYSQGLSYSKPLSREEYKLPVEVQLRFEAVLKEGVEKGKRFEEVEYRSDSTSANSGKQKRAEKVSKDFTAITVSDAKSEKINNFSTSGVFVGKQEDPDAEKKLNNEVRNSDGGSNNGSQAYQVVTFGQVDSSRTEDSSPLPRNRNFQSTTQTGGTGSTMQPQITVPGTTDANVRNLGSQSNRDFSPTPKEDNSALETSVANLKEIRRKSWAKIESPKRAEHSFYERTLLDNGSQSSHFTLLDNVNKTTIRQENLEVQTNQNGGTALAEGSVVEDSHSSRETTEHLSEEVGGGEGTNETKKDGAEEEESKDEKENPEEGNEGTEVVATAVVVKDEEGERSDGSSPTNVDSTAATTTPGVKGGATGSGTESNNDEELTFRGNRMSTIQEMPTKSGLDDEFASSAQDVDPNGDKQNQQQQQLHIKNDAEEGDNSMAVNEGQISCGFEMSPPQASGFLPPLPFLPSFLTL